MRKNNALRELLNLNAGDNTLDAYLKGNMTVDEVIAEAENYGGDSQ